MSNPESGKKLTFIMIGGGLAFGLAALAASNGAHAALRNQRLSANATSYCQTALPVFDGKVRKRPMAIENEGPSTAFVTCAFARNANARAMVNVSMAISSQNEMRQDVTCTLVAGIASDQSVQFVPKTLPVIRGSDGVVLSWFPLDFAGQVFPNTQMSMSCGLPPGVSLNDSQILFSEDVGA